METKFQLTRIVIQNILDYSMSKLLQIIIGSNAKTKIEFRFVRKISMNNNHFKNQN